MFRLLPCGIFGILNSVIPIHTQLDIIEVFIDFDVLGLLTGKNCEPFRFFFPPRRRLGFLVLVTLTWIREVLEELEELDDSSESELSSESVGDCLPGFRFFFLSSVEDDSDESSDKSEEGGD